MIDRARINFVSALITRIFLAGTSIDRARPITPPGVSRSVRRHALLIGVSTAAPAADEQRSPASAKPLDTAGAIERVASTLRAHFGFVVERCEGAHTTRDEILRRLDAWVTRCKRERADACLLYYFGHGGRARFTDLPGCEDHEFAYVTCRRIEPANGDGRRPFEAILGLELSVRLGELVAAERSVVVILDSCYSGQAVREGRRFKSIHEMSAPDWVRRLVADPHEGLAVDSNPDLVRLAGSPPKRESHAMSTTEGRIGRMTNALLTTIEEFGRDAPNLTWDAVVHRVRQRVIDEVGEGQWVTFAGPREQLLFSPVRATCPRTVGLVPDPRVSSHAWLRAGALQGVRIDDRWAVSNPVSGGHALGRGRVLDVELNRARVEFDGNLEIERLRSDAAELIAAHERMTVVVDADQLRALVEASPWLRVATKNDLQSVSLLEFGADLRVEDPISGWPSFAWPSSGSREQLLEVLEDRARSRRLLESVSRLRRAGDSGLRAELPLSWTWGVLGAQTNSSLEGATLFETDRVWFRFESTSERAFYWFVNLIYIDPVGRPWQLNARLPEGLELERHDREHLGRRIGADEQGLRLPWTPELEHPVSGRATLLVLATSVPIELNHLLRNYREPMFDASANPDIQTARLKCRTGRRKRPELCWAWSCEVVEFEVRGGKRSE